MDPVFTLQWPEFLLANRLQKMFQKSKGFSVLIPTSRQEKGFDLAIIRGHRDGSSRVVTIQVKASRSYSQEPPKRKTTKRWRFHTWFNRFNVPKQADYFLLFGLYAPDAGRTKMVGHHWYKDCTLLFTQQEMKKFVLSCRTRAGSPDGVPGEQARAAVHRLSGLVSMRALYYNSCRARGSASPPRDRRQFTASRSPSSRDSWRSRPAPCGCW